MSADFEHVAVENNEAAQRFEAHIGDDLAVANYTLSGGSIIFTHTEVPEAFEGHGVGHKIVGSALDYARTEGLSVIPLCPFVGSFIRRHAEYQDLVHPDYRERVLRTKPTNN